MASRRDRKPVDRRRTRTKPTVQQRPAKPLKVSIVTHPNTDSEGVSVSGDIDLVKAALLYADEVELISIGAAMIGAMVSLAEGGEASLISLLQAIGPDGLARVSGGEPMPPEIIQNLPALIELSRTPMGRELGLEAFEQFDAMMADAVAELREVAEDMTRQSGAAELIPCIEAGILTLSDAGLSQIDSSQTDAMVDQWVDLLRQRLNDGSTRLLFDDGAGSLVASMIREGMIRSNDLGLKHAGEAATGSGFITRLPAFPQAPMDELLDLRSDLQGPLVRYRAAVMKISGDLPRLIGPELETHIDDLWRREVAPAIEEIRETLADHGLVREIARHAETDMMTLLVGGTGLLVGVSAGLENWVSAAVAGVGASIHAGVRGARSASESRRTAKRTDLFYLYETNRRLGG
jgi:hypothetical protein